MLFMIQIILLLITHGNMKYNLKLETYLEAS